MKRFILLSVYLLICGFAYADAPITYDSKVLLDNHFRVHQYKTITVAQCDCQYFISKHPKMNDRDRVVSDITGMNDDVKNQLELFADKYAYMAPATAVKQLKIQAFVSEYNSGNEGDLISSGPSGFCKYIIRLWDGTTEVARIEVSAPIAKANQRIFQSNDLTQTHKSTANVPRYLVQCLQTFVYSH